MNKVILIGRLTKDPEIRYSQAAEPVAIARFTLAVNRRFKREGEQDADFIPCVCFGRQAEFVEKYLKRGMQIALSGRIQIRSFDDAGGQRKWFTEVIAEDIEFTESRAAYETRMAQSGGGYQSAQPSSGYAPAQGGYNSAASAGQGAPAEQGAPAGQGAPAEQAAPAAQGAPAGQGAPAEQAAPVAQAAPAEPPFEPEGFAAITESIDEDDLPF